LREMEATAVYDKFLFGCLSRPKYRKFGDDETDCRSNNLWPNRFLHRKY